MRVLNADGRRRLSVVVVRVIKRHHKYMGKDGSTLEIPAIKWSLNVPMAFSILLVRCMCGGTSWKLIRLEMK